jgi:uncharacterized protein (AIM24 family)
MPKAPKAPSNQGLFLKHFEAGKQAYEAGRLDDAERDLVEAYLLRPRDHKIMNLLGLLYFKQENYEKAEEVYRKLAAESPEANTLFYNLGLIYLKLNRLEDAELAFLKSLQLARENPKINFYLGSIYERQRRFQDAIFQYRQAGANVMVRRVEDKLQPGARPARPPRQPSDEDTAEFRGAPPPATPRARVETEQFLPAPTLKPVGDVLLADNAPARAPRRPDPEAVAEADTRPPQPAGSQTVPPGVKTLPPGVKTLPPGSATLPPGRSADIVAFLAGLPAAPSKEKTGITGITSGGTGIFTAAAANRAAAPPPRAVEPFRLIQRNLMEVVFSGKVFVKQGTVYSYSGNLTFWIKEKRPGATPSLVIVSGNGKLLLSDREREINISAVDGPLCVQPAALVACEDGVTPRYIRLGSEESGPEFVTLEGRGLIALSVATRPLTLAVTPDQPVAVAAPSVIMWAGDLKPQLVQDEALNQALLGPRGSAPALVRLEGSGRVLMEQTP